MAWDFETDPEYQAKLDWADTFVREEVEPLDYVFPHMQFVPMTPEMRRIIDPLKDQVRAHTDLCGCHRRRVPCGAQWCALLRTPLSVPSALALVRRPRVRS